MLIKVFMSDLHRRLENLPTHYNYPICVEVTSNGIYGPKMTDHYVNNYLWMDKERRKCAQFVPEPARFHILRRSRSHLVYRVGVDNAGGEEVASVFVCISNTEYRAKDVVQHFLTHATVYADISVTRPYACLLYILLDT